ncbi:MAG: CPBP family intramembrane metalloprotease [Bacteroidales bacterium]|nr:CPBP family intramembrane metalloprotease [Bacteroidales bacterium]
MKKSNQFAVLVCALSFVAAGIFYLSTRGMDATKFQTIRALFSSIYMFLPLISSLVLMKINDKKITSKALAASFKINWAWVFAWLSPIVMVFATLLCSKYILGMDLYENMNAALFGMVGDNPQAMAQLQAQMNAMPLPYFWITLISGLFAGLTINAVLAFGEEAGWRGYLFNQFKSQAFWKPTLYIGVLWGFWHAPLILMGHNYPQHPVAGVFMMMLFCLMLSPICNYIRIKAKSSIAVAVFHGTFNALAGIATMMVMNTNDLLRGLPGFSGIIALLLLNVLLFLYDNYISKDKIFTSKIEF